MEVNPDQRIIHVLPIDGRKVITILIPNGGFLGYHWGPPNAVTFGHGATREEAFTEVANKIRRRAALDKEVEK